MATCISEQSGMVEFRDIDKEIPVTHLMALGEAPPRGLLFHSIDSPSTRSPKSSMSTGMESGRPSLPSNS